MGKWKSIIEGILLLTGLCLGLFGQIVMSANWILIIMFFLFVVIAVCFPPGKQNNNEKAREEKNNDLPKMPD